MSYFLSMKKNVMDKVKIGHPKLNLQFNMLNVLTLAPTSCISNKVRNLTQPYQ